MSGLHVQGAGAHRRHVRRDRAALRHAQSPAQRRPRLAAGAGARCARCELTGRERVLDVCTGTADLAIEAATVAARPRARRRRHRLLRRDAAPSASTKIRARRPRGARAARARRRDAPAAARRVVRRGDGRVRHSQRRRPGRGAARNSAACCGRAAASRFSSSASPTMPGLRAGAIGWYFRHVLPRIGRLVSRHHDAYAYLPASVARVSVRRRLCGAAAAARASRRRAHVPLTLRRRLSLRRRARTLAPSTGTRSVTAAAPGRLP